MGAAIVELFPPNPPPAQLPPLGVFTRILIERAPDAGGAPGAFVQIDNVAIDASDEFTYYADVGGDDTAWYRVRYANTALTSFSGYGDSIQAGDSVIRQWARGEFPETSLTLAMWNRWGQQVLIDLYAHGIWKLDEAQLTLTTQAGGVVDETYAIPAKIRDVIGVEIRDNANGLLVETLEDGEWVGHTNRKLRIFNASTAYGYWIVGKAQYRALGELTDDFYMLALHLLFVKVLLFRKRQRANFKQFVTMDPTTDMNPDQLGRMIADERLEVAERVKALALAEPAIPIPTGY